MPRQLFPGVLIALSLGVARPAHARFTALNYSNYCSTGSFVTCMSVQILATTTGHGTLLTLRFTNLQGWLPQDNSGGSTVGDVDFRVPCGTPFCSEMILTSWTGPVARGTAQAFGPCAGCWDASLDLGSGGVDNYTDNVLNPDFGQYGGSGIDGCSPSGLHPSYFRTCGPNGWVELTFSFTSRFDAQDVYLSVPFGNNNGGAGCLFLPGTGADPSCQQVVTVTPEPGSLILLATGLASVAGLRWRRKKSAPRGT